MTQNNKTAASAAGNADNVSYQYSSHGVVRTVGDRLREVAVRGDFSTTRIAAQHLKGKPLTFLPNTTMEFMVGGENSEFSSLKEALDAMQYWTIPDSTIVRLRVQKGTWVESEKITLTADLRNVGIYGVTPTTIGSISAHEVKKVVYEWTEDHDTGTDWTPGQIFHYHKITYNCSSTTNVEVGNFLFIRNGGSSSDPTKYLHYGAWEITHVDHVNNRITVFNSCHEVSPSLNFTASNAVVTHTTILCAGSRVLNQGNTFLEMRHGAQLREFNHLAIVGRGLPWDEGNRGTFGYASPNHYYGLILRDGASVTLNTNTVVCGFSNDNLVVEGTLYFNGVTTNGWGHNVVTRTTGVITCSQAISAGGWLDGMTTQDGGVTTGQLFVLGNNRIGLNHSQGSSSSALTVTAIGNGLKSGSGGVSLMADGAICAGTIYSGNNNGYGVRLNRNAQLEVNALTVKDNNGPGVEAYYGSSAFIGTLTASGNDKSSTATDKWDLMATSNSQILINTASSLAALKTNPILNTIGRNRGFIGTTATDLGFSSSLATNQKRDIIFNSKGQLMVGTESEYNITGSESAMSAHIAGTVACGPCVPNQDNTWRLGTGNFRWKELWCANGTIKTSDIRDKTDLKNCPFGLEFIKQSQPMAYRWKEGNDKHVYFGFMAQDVQKLIAKSGEVDIGMVTADEKGGRLGLRYDELIPILAKAIIDLNEELEALKEVLPTLN